MAVTFARRSGAHRGLHSQLFEKELLVQLSPSLILLMFFVVIAMRLFEE
jgi:hypothetical protein